MIPRLHLALAGALILAVGACAMGPPPAPAPTPTPTPTPPAAVTPPPNPASYRGVPGFDTRAYPGDAVMQGWLASSPYRWVGYYLPAPCHTDSSWVGRRQALERIGWGTAIIFTGEQDWRAAPSIPDSAAAGATQSLRCTRTNLTAERGAADAAQADSAANVEGFPAGSTIYLDVERVDSVSTPLATYARAWIAGMLDAGRYRPGVYAHVRNADSLRAIQQSEYSRRAASGARFWVAGGTPGSAAFDVGAAPAESGLPYATVWQGQHDARQAWAGTTLRIDADVAATRSPSAPDGP